jgi:hypothetical protein
VAWDRPPGAVLAAAGTGITARNALPATFRAAICSTEKAALWVAVHSHRSARQSSWPNRIGLTVRHMELLEDPPVSGAPQQRCRHVVRGCWALSSARAGVSLRGRMGW